MKNNLLKKFLGFSIGNVSILILGLISTPIITRMVSTVDYGYFSMFTLITSMFTVLLIFGFDHSYARFFCNEEKQNIGAFLYKCIRIPIYIAILFSILFIIFGNYISVIAFERKSSFIVLLILIQTIVGLLNRFALLNVRMKQKAKKYSYLQIVNKLIFIISVLCIFFFEKSFYSIIIATVFSNIITTVIAIITEREVWNIKNFAYSAQKKCNTDFKKIVTYGSPMVLTFLLGWLFQYIDRFFIKSYQGFSELGVYTAAFSIVSLLNVIQNSFTTFWAPVSFEKYKSNSMDYDFFKNINDIVSLVMFLCCIFLLLFKDIIVLLLGPNYREASYIMPFLVFMPVMYTISETTVIGINFKMKPKFHIIISVFALLVNLFGNILLIPKFGAEGAAIATGISYIFLFYMRTIISKKLYPVKYSIKKISIMIMILLIFSTYCTLNPFNIYVILLGATSLFVLSILYKDTIKYVASSLIHKKY